MKEKIYMLWWIQGTCVSSVLTSIAIYWALSNEMKVSSKIKFHIELKKMFLSRHCLLLMEFAKNIFLAFKNS